MYTTLGRLYTWIEMDKYYGIYLHRVIKACFSHRNHITGTWIIAVGSVMSRSEATSMMHHHSNKPILQLLRVGYIIRCETERRQVKHFIKLYRCHDLPTTVPAAPPVEWRNNSVWWNMRPTGRVFVDITNSLLLLLLHNHYFHFFCITGPFLPELCQVYARIGYVPKKAGQIPFLSSNQQCHSSGMWG